MRRQSVLRPEMLLVEQICAAVDAAVERAHARTDVAVVVIHGDPRVGMWAAKYRASRWGASDSRAVFRVDFAEYRVRGGVDLARVCRVLLRRLGVFRWRVPKTFPARAAKYRKIAAKRRVLLVLGNADQAAQIRPFVAGGRGSVVLAPSRHRLAGLRTEHAEFVTVEATQHARNHNDTTTP